MQRLPRHHQPQMRQPKPNARRRWSRSTAVLALALVLLAGCGQAEQRADQPSSAPLSPALATPEATTPTSAAQGIPTLTRPTPDSAQAAASMTVAVIQTGGAEWRNTRRATATAKAAWAQTPEPTILPPADTPRLRDQWPAAPQQAAAPTHLYLRSVSNDPFKPDTFWKVHLSDAQIRRLPAFEKPSVDQSAQVSPDGRFLAYVTGSTKTMERTLRVLDLAQQTDLGIAVPVNAGFPRCLQPFAWSPDGHTLMAIVAKAESSDLGAQLQRFELPSNPAPQTLLELSYPLELLGWLDAEHLLLAHWKPKEHLELLLSVDNQGHVTPIAVPHSEPLSCASLSPDGQNLIYNQKKGVKRLHLATAQEEAFPWWPSEVFWLEDGRTLLFSPFNTVRRVWLHSLDQPLEQNQPGIFLSPPHQAVFRFGIIGVSPDKHTLVACEKAPQNNPRIHDYDSRTWLYHIADNHWTLIRTNPSGACDVVLGWGNARGVQ